MRDGGEPGAVRQPGPSQPCGERPLAARSATLDVSGLEIRGAVDRDGVFAISPYQWIDAYLAASAQPSEITALVDGAGGPRTVSAVLDARWLASHAAGFLAHADFDPAIQPLRLVPGLVAGALGVGLVTADDGAAVRVVLPLRNPGPGDAWAVRGQITAPATPAIDGRMIYVGKLARGAAVTRELVIPSRPARRPRCAARPSSCRSSCATATTRRRRPRSGFTARSPMTRRDACGSRSSARGSPGSRAARALARRGHDVDAVRGGAAAGRARLHGRRAAASPSTWASSFTTASAIRAFFALLGELGVDDPADHDVVLGRSRRRRRLEWGSA